MSIGSMMRLQRETLGYSLPDLAVYLHIREAYLEAIEADDFNALPEGSGYRVGFIKSYAGVLQLDAEKTVDLFRKEQVTATQKQPLIMRRPIAEARVPTFSLIFVVVALFAAGWIGWSYLHRSDRTLADEVPAVPERLQEKPPQPQTPVAVATANDAMPLTAAPNQPQPTQPVAPIATATADPQADTEPDEPHDDAYAGASRQAAATTPTPTVIATGTVLGGGTGDSRVQIQAIADSWVQIRDASRIVYTGILHAGDTYRVPAEAGWSMVAGNAGGITLAVDGKPGTALGPQGQVIRNVKLDAP